MTGGGEVHPPPLRPRRSRIWSGVFRVSYRLLRVLDPLVRSAVANDVPGLSGVVEIRTVGRRTGRLRRNMTTLLSHDGRWYVGHPNGSSGWIRNAEASGWVEIDPPGRNGPRFGVHRLEPGPERDAVIRVTADQQPLFSNLLYRAAQRHIAAVGVYHRLEPIAAGADAAAGIEGGR